MQWYWWLLVIIVAVLLPLYVKILAEFAYRGKVGAMRKLFKNKNEEE